MAFWGVEVKPGKPFTHEHDESKGRLHISMATLGFGNASARSTLQCNVGNRSPVYLCSLYPGTTESLQLNLELEEVENVIFSVIGPRSIHLCGYYLGSRISRNANISDDSKSYGEDIANTETDRSNYSDEDEYGVVLLMTMVIQRFSHHLLFQKKRKLFMITEQNVGKAAFGGLGGSTNQ